MVPTNVVLPEWKGLLASRPAYSHVRKDGEMMVRFAIKHYLGGKKFQKLEVFAPAKLAREHIKRYASQQGRWITVQGTRLGTAPVINATDVRWFIADLPF